MKILVTGSRGFVGRNLVSQLHNIRDGKARNYGIAGEELTITNMTWTVTLPNWMSIADKLTLSSIWQA